MISRIFKYLAFGSLLLIAVVLVVSSFMVKANGTDAIAEQVYHSRWFIYLWLFLVLTGFVYICRTYMRKCVAIFLLHLSFIVILAGAFITHLTADGGSMILAKDAPPSSMYEIGDGTLMRLNFRVELEDFEVLSSASGDVEDYCATLKVTDRNREYETVQISMNNIFEKDSYRFYLMGYDESAITLHVNHDPHGLPVTYSGYLLLLLSVVSLFFTKRYGFRPLLAKYKGETVLPPADSASDIVDKTLLWVSSTLLAAVALLVIYYWISAGVFPATNGVAALLLFAWFLLLAGVFLRKHVPAMLYSGLALTAVMLLVVLFFSDALTAPVLPVLRTPLLAIHVTLIIIAYSLFALLAVNAVVALYCHYTLHDDAKVQRLALLGKLLLYPAVMLLMVGVFVGAVWANISWGRYWGWDPKEVWALITLLLCALPLHSRSLPLFGKPICFHIYSFVIFIAMLFTYFGVNCLIGGMHSYM